MKLTPAQERAYMELDYDKWKNAYQVGESLATLDALVRKGYAEKRDEDMPGASSFPKTVIQYRRKR